MGSIESLSLSLFDTLNFTPDLKPTYGPRHSRRKFRGSKRLFHNSRLARISTEENSTLK